MRIHLKLSWPVGLFWWLALGTFVVAAAETGPRVFSIPPGALLKLKAQLAAGDESVRPAFDGLIRDADRALRSPPVSVTEKPKLAPSGDPHDYYSTAPYWWPDPARPDGLPYIRKDGQRNPESGGRFSDSPRLGRTARNAETLALAYYLTGREGCAEHAARLLRVFFLDPTTRMNPNFNHAQAVPGVNTGRGTGMIESRTLTSVADAAALLEGSAHWSAADEEGMKAWLSTFLDWALTSPNGQDERAATNNHGTFYDVQVTHLALFTGRNELARQIVEAAKEKRIAAQIKPDGTQPEELRRAISFHYSRFNLEAHFRLATLAEHVGVDLWHFETAEGAGLRKALDLLVPYAEQPAKTWPYPQEREPNRSALAPLLRQAYAVYRDARYLRALRNVSDGQTQREALFY